MKLNKNGSKKLCDLVNTSVYDIFWKDEDAFLEREDGFVGFELDQSDVQGAVVLTIEEAKELYEALDRCLEISIWETEGFKPRFNAEREIRNRFKEQIRQAEKENETK